MLYGNDVTNARGCAFRRCKLKLRKCAVREQSSRGGEEGARERARALIKAHCNKEHFLFTLPRSGSGRRAGFGFGFSSPRWRRGIFLCLIILGFTRSTVLADVKRPRARTVFNFNCRPPVPVVYPAINTGAGDTSLLRWEYATILRFVFIIHPAGRINYDFVSRHVRLSYPLPPLRSCNLSRCTLVIDIWLPGID